MEAPLICEGCGTRLETILMVEDRRPYYSWRPNQRRYVIEYEGTCHMECPECGQNLSEDYEFNTPEEYEPPLKLWRVTFDGLDDDTIVLEAYDEEDALETAKDLHPDETNLKVTETEQHFPE